MRTLAAAFFFIFLCATTASAQKAYHGDGIDDVLRFVPLTAAVGMKVCGVESRSTTRDFFFHAGVSTLVTVAVTYGLKQSVSKERPDGTDHRAFPSGHTSFAFSGAHLLHKEYGRVSPWISVAGYAVAGVTAADRLRRNRHEWEDVCAGAAIGILSTELSYFLGKHLLKKSSGSCQVAVTPQSFAFNVVF